ncbi:hypothetical protein GCM10020000_84150 [Streptomyces olivoverticillatus]
MFEETGVRVKAEGLVVVREYIQANHPDGHRMLSGAGHRVDAMFRCRILQEPAVLGGPDQDSVQLGVDWVALDKLTGLRTLPPCLLSRHHQCLGRSARTGARSTWATPMSEPSPRLGRGPVREPMDLGAYTERARTGPCFICAFLAGHPDYEHHVIAQDGEHVAFLDRWPTLPGKVLVAPRAHLEHVVRDLDEPAYARLMLFVRRIALAMEEVCRPERTYVYSLGSRLGNAHVHWHIAGLPRASRTSSSSSTHSWWRTASSTQRRKKWTPSPRGFARP